MGKSKSSVYVFTSFPLLSEDGNNELAAAREVFGADHVVEHLYEIPAGSLVIPRYRALPFGKLLEEEVVHNGSELINTYHQHRNIANSRTWAPALDELTARQYTVHDLPHLPEGEYFVKGETNSRKHDWFGSAYAPNRQRLGEIVRNLQQDSMIGTQEIIIKPFQNFRVIETGVNGQPIFHERRVFTLDGEILCDAPYWSNFDGAYDGLEYDHDRYQTTLQTAIDRIKHLARFVVVDMAEYPDGSWAVVELNDGSMSGLSENDPQILWTRFRDQLA